MRQDDRLESLEREVKALRQRMTSMRLQLDRLSMFNDGPPPGEQRAECSVDLLGAPVVKTADAIARMTARGWVTYLNEQAGRAFEVGSKETVRLVKARLADGHSREDLHLVAWYCCRIWRGTAQARYLRPSTLLVREKFQERLDDAKLEHSKVSGAPNGRMR